MTVCSSVNQNEDDLISCVQYLIKFGANVNSCDKNGNSCLIYAAKSGKCGIVSELIENNAVINHVNKEKWSVSLNDYIFCYFSYLIIFLIKRHCIGPQMKATAKSLRNL